MQKKLQGFLGMCHAKFLYDFIGIRQNVTENQLYDFAFLVETHVNLCDKAKTLFAKTDFE